MSKKDDPKSEQSPWQKGTTIKGVVPPGRRLSNEKRKTKWSASGVKGVTPPGNLDPDEGPSADWYEREAKVREKKEKENQRALQKAHGFEGRAHVRMQDQRALADVFDDLCHGAPCRASRAGQGARTSRR